MKKILVVYFTQTGQAKKALDGVLKPFIDNSNYQLQYHLVKPKKTFPYPWKYTEFFDAFPETVNGIPCELEDSNLDVSAQFDLVVIAYQPWFLSVCIPINSFLLSPEAKTLLNNKPVVTIINCRNMWVGAQEKMKKQLVSLNAKLVGNITFVDRSSNLTSLVTVLAFVLKGTKEKFMGIFPRYGVNDKDLDKSPEFGNLIMKHLEENKLPQLQEQLNNIEAIDIRPNILLMEGRGRALFPLYANYISKKGTQGSEQRKTRVRVFGVVLPIAILILSPIITVISRLLPVVAKKKFDKEIAYYSQNSLRES